MGVESNLELERPRQAVILAGGRGTRLGALTQSRPKPMVEICGKPFLEYQIEQLREQGFERVLLLLGYLSHVIRDYFGDGARWGVNIQYVVTDVDDETGRRMKAAESFLDPRFLMLYCDNYWPMQFSKMWQRLQTSAASALLTVYRNQDGYTRNCVRVEPDGRISLYDKSCRHPTLNGVEISYAILARDTVGQLGAENLPFETTVYPDLIAREQLAAYVTDHRYVSVGSQQRMALTEEFFRRRKTVILDRDGVLNAKPARADYVTRWDEFKWLPGAQAALGLLREHGYRVVIVSNQAGIARGVVAPSDLEEIHRRMSEEVEAAGGKIDAIYHCPHGWDAGCDCRKPKPGMLFQAQRDLTLDLSRTVFFGDDERDAEAAEQAGCPFIWVSEQRPLIDSVSQLLKQQQPEGDDTYAAKSIDHRA